MGKMYVCLMLIFAITLVWIIPFNVPVTFDYWGQMLEDLGENQPPSLTNGYSYSGGFIEGAKATANILTIPFRWAWYVLEQITICVSYFTGGGSLWDS